MDQQTDAWLVATALAGEAGAFCALVRRYQDHVYGVAVGVLADFHLALDAAQEAFLCAWCDLGKLKDPQRFGAWLCGIARNTALELRRDWQRRKALAVRAAELAGPEEEPSPERSAVASEEQALVQGALLRINEKDREALTLYYADGLSYAEISGFTGISLGTLKGRLQRGRAALRKELAMVEHACKDNAPDEAFARRLEEAIGVFGAKGPATNHLPSAWHRAIMDQTQGILDAGEQGFRIDMALSHSGSARQRWFAVTRLGLRHDDRSLHELERMLEDRSARIRSQAVRWYAARVHPEPSVTGPHAIGTAADTCPPGVQKLLTRLSDESFNVRLTAVQAIRPYAQAGDQRATAALRRSLDDPKHKVRHAAARILAVPCPGCGRTWE